MLKLESVETKKLSTKTIREICVLRNTHWKFGLKSQLKYFKNNIKLNDIHNCFYIKGNLVGYTLLRKRKIIFSNKKINYFLFDTLIIKKNLRKKKLSSLMMLFNNNVILNHNKISFLTCGNELVNFYKKFKWIRASKKKFEIMDRNFNSNGMFFNFGKKKIYNLNKPLNIYINK